MSSLPGYSCARMTSIINGCVGVAVAVRLGVTEAVGVALGIGVNVGVALGVTVVVGEGTAVSVTAAVAVAASTWATTAAAAGVWCKVWVWPHPVTKSRKTAVNNKVRWQLINR